MRQRTLAAVTVAAAFIIASVAWEHVAGQAQNAAAPANGTVKAGEGNTARTPWGDPDLQGIWSSGYVEVPLERPDTYNGREFMTDEEAAAERKKLLDRQDHSTGALNQSGRERAIQVRTTRSSAAADVTEIQRNRCEALEENTGHAPVFSVLSSTLPLAVVFDVQRAGSTVPGFSL